MSDYRIIDADGHVMELDSVGVNRSLWFNFANREYIYEMTYAAGFRRAERIDSTEGCGWHHLVAKYGDEARYEPWLGVTFIK